MQCISPLLIDPRGSRRVVACGKCGFCLQTKRHDWSFRLNQELKVSSTAKFVTLTYEDDVLPVSELGLPTLRKVDMQLFMKKLRKWCRRLTPEPVRFYSVGEYGTVTSRPHYHSILFNVPSIIYPRMEEIWNYGMVHVGTVTEASIAYVTKYVINKDGDYQGRDEPFATMSRRPGLGSNYLATHRSWHRADMRNYSKVNGTISRLPRFYKEKIFSGLEREKLSRESLALSDERYLETVEGLREYASDPGQYYDECRRRSVAQVVSKVNQLNKF